jgi:hypothetical protein
VTYEIVLAHGKGAQFEIPAIQSEQWAAALKFSLARVDSKFAQDVNVEYAYFGDITRTDAARDLPKFLTSKGDLVSFDAESKRINVTTPFEPGAAAVGAGSRIVDKVLPDWILGRMLRPQLPDVFQYLEDSGYRIDTNARLIEKCVDHGASVIVGFSMGSIVGYDVLRIADHTFPVKALITAGSPIGMGPVNRPLRELASAEQTPMFPRHLRLWINLWSDSDAATGIHGDELAAMFPDESDRGRTIQSGQNYGRTATPTNVFGAHDPLDYLSSLAMGIALHTALLDAEAAGGDTAGGGPQ